jgi:hypothetical protein
VIPFLYTNYVRGDGFSDIIVNSKPKYGRNSVYFGNKTHSFDAQRDFEIKPAISYDFSGRSVSNAGDVNGDGYDDLIIGVPYAARCYVMFGTKNGFENMTEGFTIFGAQSSDLTGWSVSGAGDVNNDTFADVIIGAPYVMNEAGVVSGAAYINYGGSQLMDVRLVELDVSRGLVIYGEMTQDALGLSVGGVGDVNGDGFDDVIVSALLTNNLYSGAAYVIYGRNALISFAVDQMTTSQGFTLQGPNYSWFGYSVSGAGKLWIE